MHQVSSYCSGEGWHMSYNCGYVQYCYRALDGCLGKKLFNTMPLGDTSVPAELEPLLGKELVLKLKLNKYNLVDGLKDYGVSTVYTPEKELKSAHAKNVLAVVRKNLHPTYLYLCKKNIC